MTKKKKTHFHLARLVVQQFLFKFSNKNIMSFRVFICLYKTLQLTNKRKSFYKRKIFHWNPKEIEHMLYSWLRNIPLFSLKMKCEKNEHFNTFCAFLWKSSSQNRKKTFQFQRKLIDFIATSIYIKMKKKKNKFWMKSIRAEREASNNKLWALR